MAIYASELVQRGHSFAIVDEVDSILIDEARTPLIISGQGDESTQLYTIVDNFVSRLTCRTVASVDEKEEEDPNETADYIVDEKARTVTLTSPRPDINSSRGHHAPTLGVHLSKHIQYSDFLSL